MSRRKPSFIVSESTAGKRISTYVVLRPGNTADVAAKIRILHGYTCKVEAQVWNKDETYNLFNGSASGGGYDKTKSALDGLTIDGIRICDDCAFINWQEEYPDLCILAGYTATGEKSGGSVLAAMLEGLPPHLRNRADIDQIIAKWPDLRLANLDRETGLYKSLYVVSGLDRLKARGYTVIQAI